MSLRAYYRDPTAGDLSLPQDSGRPVSEQKLRALGCKWWLVEGSLDQRMEKFKELSKSLGFEDGDYEHFYDLSKQTGTPHDLAMMPKDVAQMWGQNNLLSFNVLVLYVAGKAYLDLKEPGTDAFIRLASGHEDALLDVAVHVLFRATDPASVVTFGEEVDKHPTRVDYVQSVTGGTEA
ncbi:hypothetical protein PM082_019490 [Marasmius tenuissimus]|nr:hypothetical protein PM082_019490 [Marasmius tenuissimus]